MSRELDVHRIEVVDDVAAEALRRMTPAERIRLGLGSREFAARVMEGGLRYQHPDWPDAAVLEEVRRRLLGATS